MNMSTSESKQPKSVCIILEDESFEDDINHISEGSGIYVEKDNRGQLLKNLPFCSSINGWLKLYVDMDCMYVRMLNELTLSKRKVVIALRNEFRIYQYNLIGTAVSNRDPHFKFFCHGSTTR